MQIRASKVKTKTKQKNSEKDNEIKSCLLLLKQQSVNTTSLRRNTHTTYIHKTTTKKDGEIIPP